MIHTIPMANATLKVPRVNNTAKFNIRYYSMTITPAAITPKANEMTSEQVKIYIGVPLLCVNPEGISGFLGII
jgi:hypothetical protein